MIIVTARYLRQATAKYLDAAKEIASWAKVVNAVYWTSFREVRKHFPDADAVDGYVIFNIRHNRYRLITVIHYSKTIGSVQARGHVYIRSFLTHSEYNDRANWDRKHASRKPR